MTVPQQTPIIAYAGNGVSTLFAFPFKILESGDLIVLLDGTQQTVGSQYSINGIGNASGGSVQFNTPPAAGGKIILYRDVALERDTDYQDNGDLLADTVNADFDRIWMALQDIGGSSRRAIQYPLTEYSADGTLPEAALRAMKLLGFDDQGNQTMIPLPASVGAGNLIDELGSDGKPGFKAGVDYTAGVSTSITLANDYGSKANLTYVSFDSSLQGADSYSLSGKVLTFLDAAGNPTPIPAGFSKVFVKGGTTVSLLTPPDGSVSDVKIAPSSRLYDRIANIFDVMDYGATGVGGDDTAAFIAGVAAVSARGGGVLYVPPGVYGIAVTGVNVPSNVTILGAGRGATVLKPLGNLTAGTLSIAGKTNVHFEGITFDGVNSTTNIPVVTYNLCDRFSVTKCEFLNFAVFGLSINGGTNGEVQDNYFNFPTPVGTQNQALNISVSAGSVNNVNVRRNVMIGSAMDVAGSYLKIEGNFINGWKFGAGVTVEVGSEELQIIGNVCTGGTGNDVNNTICLGIENWSTRSLIANNICASNDGDGIDNGGQQCTITGNICFNNGKYSGGGHGSGIVTRYTNGAQNGNNSVVVGNVCFDTNGASGTQSYGYADENTNVARVTIRGNFFNQNKTRPMNVQGSAMDVDTPILHGSVGFTPGTLANGASAGGGITVPGARFGDTVVASWSDDQQGNKLFAFVKSNDLVNFRFENNTGGSSTFGAGTVRATVTKPVNWDAY